MAMTAEQKKRAKEKREAAKAEAEAQSLAAYQAKKDAFAQSCKDGDLADDPIWNSAHPLHKAVNSLIDQGLYAPEAEAQVRAIGVEQVEKDAAEAEAGLKDLAAWLAEQTWSDFAQSLASQYQKKGYLSPKQEAAAYSMREKTEASRKRRSDEKAAKASDINLDALPSGYYAVPNGDTRLKVRVARPTKNSRWYGWTFVSDGAEYGARTNYGKQAEGGTYQGQIQDQLRAILADPFEAQKAYGQLTGTCGACGRQLEDETSVALGIGPICAAKW